MLKPKTQENSDNTNNIHIYFGQFFAGPGSNVTTVLEVKWTELHQICARHVPIVGALKVQIQFRYVASFRNEGDIKVTAVENRDQITNSPPRVKVCAYSGALYAS